jgi:hypothetical protein
MALSVTTDLTVLTTAESFVAPLVSWGSGGTGAAATETDYFAQGTACISRGVTGSVIKGVTYDNTTGLNFTTTHNGKLVYMWLRNSTPGLSETRANGGVRVVLASGTTTPGDAAGVWSAWYVDGSDTIVSTDGWKCYVVDPNSTPSATFGGGVDKTAIRWFSGVMRTNATAKGQNFGFDQVAYGFGTINVRGTPTVPGAGFKEIASADFGTIANRYGLVTVKEGIIYAQCRIALGDGISTNITEFTSNDEVVVWNHPTYYDGTREVPCIKDYRPDGTPYFGIVRTGNTTANTNVTFGAKVGTGNTASGRSGGSFIGSRIKTGFIAVSGTVKSTSALKIYGAQFSNFGGGFVIVSGTATDDWMGGSISRCGTTIPGSTVYRGVSFIDNLGGTYRFFEDFKNDAVTDETLAVADPRTDWANAVGGTQLTVPGGSSFVRLDAAAAVRNVVKINSDVVGSDDHYVDAVVNFPTGSNQGKIGVIARASTTLATENYWFLQLDRPNSQVSLIRCDAGVDTTVHGPLTLTMSAETDYLIQLRGQGTIIEGFAGGIKVFTTSSTYQTNRWIGIRGTTNTSQTANAQPKITRFGAGPNTDNLGAVKIMHLTSSDLIGCSFINNNRALDITSASLAYSFASYTFSSNSIGLRNSSLGAVTIGAVGGSPDPVYEILSAGSITVNNSVTLTVTCRNTLGTAIEGIRIRIQKTSDNSLITEGSTNASGILTYSYNYSVNTPVKIIARLKGYKFNSAIDTILSTGLSVPFTMIRDDAVSMP